MIHDFCCYLLKLLLLLLFLLLCLLLQQVHNGLFSEVVSCIVNLRRSRHSAAGVTRAVLTSNASGMWGTLESELSKQQCWPFLSVRYTLSRFRSQIVRKSQLNGFPGHRRFRGNQGHRRSIFEIFVNRRNTGVVKTTGFRYIRRKSRGEWGGGGGGRKKRRGGRLRRRSRPENASFCATDCSLSQKRNNQWIASYNVRRPVSLCYGRTVAGKYCDCDTTYHRNVLTISQRRGPRCLYV